MLSHKVDKTITIRQRLKRAAIDWTLQKRNNTLYLHLWMLSSDMKLKTLPRKTLIFTVCIGALVRKVTLTLPTMHIHRGREALLNPAVRAYIETSLITLVRKSHCTCLGGARHFNFTRVHRRTFGHDFTRVYDFIRIHRIKLDLLSSIRRGKHILIGVKRH